jgi:hypothetical protein
VGGGGEADGADRASGNGDGEGVLGAGGGEMVVPFEWLEDNLLEIIFAFLDPKTLMITVPQVCRQWRQVCQGLVGVHLDLRWWNGMVPVNVLAGVADTPFVRANPGWAMGLCQLFPHIAAASFNKKNGMTDAGVVALA